MAHITLISGSPASPSRSSQLLDFVDAALRTRQRTPRRVEIRHLPARALIAADARDPALAAAIANVEGAEAVVIALPVYKASFSGALKLFLDALPQRALCGKEVLVVATGGSLAHLLALDCALLPVLSALGARRHAPHVFAVDADMPRRADGSHELEAAVAARLAHAVAQLDRTLAERAELFAHRAAAIRRCTAAFFASLAHNDANLERQRLAQHRVGHSRRDAEALFALK